MCPVSDGGVEYSLGEYCADVGCEHYHDGGFDESCDSCPAYDYYRWLKEHGFRLLRAEVTEVDESLVLVEDKGEMMNSRQLGRFKIKRCLIDEDPYQIANIFSLLQCVVVWANLSRDNDEIEYIGISPRFEEVLHGHVIPEYLLRVTTSKAGNVELVQVSLDSAETLEG